MRRIAALALAAVVSLPIVSPVAAADPLATAEPSAPAEPTPSSEPIAPPDADTGGRADASPRAHTRPDQRPVTDRRPDTGPRSRAGRRPVRIGSAEGHGQERTRGPRRREGPADRDRSIHRRPRGISGHRPRSSTRHRHREGTRADRSFKHAFRGFTARLDTAQRRALLADPSVKAVVPDEVISIAAQTTPTGVSRVGTLQSSLANIDGVDDRVDADVAIVDTGIASHPDLVVAGGYNCSSSDRTALVRRARPRNACRRHRRGSRQHDRRRRRRPGRQAVGGADPQLER